MRLLLLTLLAHLTVTAVAAAACPRAPEHVTIDTGRVIIWSDENVAYGCLRSSGRRVRLLDEDSEEGMVLARAAGRFVAFGVEYADKYDSSVWIGRVELWDLRSGRRVRRKELDHLAQGWEPVLRRLELRATGAAAFSISADSSTTSEIWLISRARARRIDRGFAVDAGSLRRAGDEVTWMHGEVQRRAPLQ